MQNVKNEHTDKTDVSYLQTVSRALNRLAREGAVELQYGSILLKDRSALERLCRPV